MHSPFVVGDCVLTKALVGSVLRTPAHRTQVAHSFILGEYFGIVHLLYHNATLGSVCSATKDRLNICEETIFKEIR